HRQHRERHSYPTRRSSDLKQEIRKLIGYTTVKGMTIVPLSMYINEDGRAKVELAAARGKKLYDKRETIAKRDAARDIDRRMKERDRKSTRLNSSHVWISYD